MEALMKHLTYVKGKLTHSVSEIDSMGGYWWLIIALLFIVLMVSASVAGRLYRQLILSLFKNES